MAPVPLYIGQQYAFQGRRHPIFNFLLPDLFSVAEVKGNRKLCPHCPRDGN